MSDEIVHYSNPQGQGQGIMPRNMQTAMEMANLMATAKLVPKHLQGSPGDCFLVINQAVRWGLDPFTVAQATSCVQGKLCYEGKLVAAVLVSTGAIKGRPDYEFSGSGLDRTITISATTSDGKVRTISGNVRDWQSNNQYWRTQPDDMLIYRGIRQWARRHAPEAMLGIVSPDEMINEEEKRPSDPNAAPPMAGRKAAVATVVVTSPQPAAAPVVDDVAIDAEYVELEAPPISDDYVGCEDAIEHATTIADLEAIKETMKATWGDAVPTELRNAWTIRKKALRAVPAAD